MTMGKKPGGSADLGARSFILTVQSVEEREIKKKKEKKFPNPLKSQATIPAGLREPPQARANDGAPVKRSGHKHLFV